MGWQETLKTLKAELAKLKLAEGKVGDLKFGAVEGDESKPGESFSDLLGSLESDLSAAGTAADGSAASTVKMTNKIAKLEATNAEQKAKLATAGDVDARVLAAETKATTATERATVAEGSLRKSLILGAARDKLDAVEGLDAGQRKTALALFNMDTSSIEVDDKGAVSGLDARLATLKTEHADTFTKKAPKAGLSGDGGGEAGANGGTADDGSGTGTKDGEDVYASQMLKNMGIDPVADKTAA